MLRCVAGNAASGKVHISWMTQPNSLLFDIHLAFIITVTLIIPRPQAEKQNSPTLKGLALPTYEVHCDLAITVPSFPDLVMGQYSHLKHLPTGESTQLRLVQ